MSGGPETGINSKGVSVMLAYDRTNPFIELPIRNGPAAHDFFTAVTYGNWSQQILVDFTVDNEGYPFAGPRFRIRLCAVMRADESGRTWLFNGVNTQRCKPSDTIRDHAVLNGLYDMRSRSGTLRVWSAGVTPLDIFGTLPKFPI